MFVIFAAFRSLVFIITAQSRFSQLDKGSGDSGSHDWVNPVMIFASRRSLARPARGSPASDIH